MTRMVLSAITLALALVTGCGGAPSDGAQAPDKHVGAGAGAGADTAQVAAGEKLYAGKCAMCHGAEGKGKGTTPGVIGKEALPVDLAKSKARTGPLKTGADLAKLIKDTMPPDARGSLSDEQSFSLTAFILHKNGVALGGKAVDAANAASLSIH